MTTQTETNSWMWPACGTVFGLQEHDAGFLYRQEGIGRYCDDAGVVHAAATFLAEGAPGNASNLAAGVQA